MRLLHGVVFLLIVGHSVAAVEYRGPDGISVDLPAGWAAFGEAKTNSFSFMNSSREAFLQVFRFTKNESMHLSEVFNLVKSSLDATGDHVPYTYSGLDAVFASIEFAAAGAAVSGFAFSARTDTADNVVIVYGPPSGLYRDELLSALDSVALSDDELTRPGPVSQFMLAENESNATANIEFGGFSSRFGVDSGEFEVAQLVVEREARILSSSAGEDIDTWKRFYRIVYRDAYSRFEQLGGEFASFAKELEPRDLAELLLNWVQSWEYTRTGTLADLLNPYEAALRESGDCDSRGLVYATMLHYAGIESVLLISSEYSHSVCAVDVDGTGARIATEKGPQLIAEVTDGVPLGMIAAEQADPEGWIVVDLDGKRGPR